MRADFAPPSDAPPPEALERLVELLRHRRAVALTGAGISTESGIPDYRGPGTRARARNPIQIGTFLADGAARRRYWARSARGWPRFAAAAPNEGHRALAALERAGHVAHVLTQNVDGLHQRAGHERVIELHGTLARVRCLGCGARSDRAELQRRIESLNPALEDRLAALAPDGDAELPDALVDGFVVPTCEACSGALRPDVVLFGEAVPRERVDAAMASVDEADLLLVLGTSLAVFSGLRFVRRATERGIPIAIVTLGETRGDDAATLRLDARLGSVLPALARELGAG